MQPSSFPVRAGQLLLDCSIVLLAIAFILVSAFVSAVVKTYKAFASWVFHPAHAKARPRAGWQQGI